jgi:hypothetical protein
LEKELENHYVNYIIQNRKIIETATILTTLKVFTIACNRVLGIGEKRLSKLFDEMMTTINNQSLTDEIFETHLDKECIQILGEESFNKYFPKLNGDDNYDEHINTTSSVN